MIAFAQLNSSRQTDAAIAHHPGSGGYALPTQRTAGRATRTIAAKCLLLAATLTFPLVTAAQTPTNTVEATTAPIDKPAGVAYDTAGNLYIAVLNDHVIRKVDQNGIITTVAGTGEEGFSGDGGQATSAQLDSPAGIAVDSAGSLYIADSHNHRIRKVVNGLITTIVGIGTPGYSGDGAAATDVQLYLPVAVSLDTAGNLYIADAHNLRIRKLTGTTITTVAGNGDEAFSGDNGPAISAGLDTPNGVVADTLVPGRFYIGDTRNQRVRAVDAAGTITTLAGTGARSYTGDGTAANVALARPRGLAVDPSGTLYLADSDNDRIRSIANGSLVTVAGDGDESFSGDTGLATGAALDTPRATAVSSTGSIAVTDSDNNRIRSVTLTGPATGTTSTIAGIAPTATESLLLAGPTSIVYGTGALTATFANGSHTATGSLTLLEAANSISTADLSANNATLSLATLVPGQHTLAASYPGDVGNPAIASGVYVVNVTRDPLIATANAIQVLYGQPIPTPTGTLAGTLPADTSNVTAVFSTPAVDGSSVGTLPITVALTGSAAPKYTVALAMNSGSVIIAQAGTKTVLATSNLAPYPTAPVTLKATVASLTTGTPTGSVQFFNGTSPLGTVALSGGIATLTTSALSSGNFTITAQYTGDPDFTASTSNALTEAVTYGDFTLTPVAEATPDVEPGRSASFSFTAAPTSGAFTLPIVFTATGLPAGALATFTPATVMLGASPANFTMTIQTSLSATAFGHRQLLAGSTLALAFLLLPFNRNQRRRVGVPGLFRNTLLVLLSFSALTIIMGCTPGSGFFGQPQQTYTIQVVGIATTPTGTTIQHTTSVRLAVQ